MEKLLVYDMLLHIVTYLEVPPRRNSVLFCIYITGCIFLIFVSPRVLYSLVGFISLLEHVKS